MRAHNFSIVTALFLFACSPETRKDEPASSAPVKTTPLIPYTVKGSYPHDKTLYTEGLLFHDNKLFESTGAASHLPQTKSAIGISDLNTGMFELRAELDKLVYFGEGILVINDKLYQLTWQNQVGFIYNAKTFKKTGQFSYLNKEGWGMTTNGRHIIMSDGTFNLTYLDTATLAPVKTVPVVKDGYGLDRINELEYINGYIYANVWQTNTIVKIDSSGQVVGQMNLEPLFDQARAIYHELGELNGIAYDPVKDRVLVTGKLWPVYYELEFSH